MDAELQDMHQTPQLLQQQAKQMLQGIQRERDQMLQEIRRERLDLDADKTAWQMEMAKAIKLKEVIE